MEFKNFITGNIKEDSNHAIFGDFDDDDDAPQKVYAKPAIRPLGEPPAISHPPRKTPANDPTVIMKNDILTKLSDLERRLANLERSSVASNGRRAG